MPFLMALGIGISLNNTKAVLEAIWSSIKRKPSEFVRTPKYGVTGHDKKDLAAQPRVHLQPPGAAAAWRSRSASYMFVCLVVSIKWWFGIG